MTGRIQEALHELASAPVPEGLAARALAGAARQRRRRIIVAVASAAVVLAAVTVGVTRGGPLASGGDPAPPGGSPAPTTVECAVASTQVVDGVRQVGPGDWPEFVQVVMAALPPRDDYVVEAAQAWCPSAEVVAGTNIAVGDGGDLTVAIVLDSGGFAFDCDDMQPQLDALPAENGPGSVAFCDPGPAMPRAYALVGQGWTIAIAVQDRGPAVLTEYHTGGQADLTPQDLAVVVKNPVLFALIPDL